MGGGGGGGKQDNVTIEALSLSAISRHDLHAKMLV